MMDKEAIRSFFFEDDESTLVGKLHYPFLNNEDIQKFSEIPYEAIEVSIEKFNIILTMLEYQYGFKSETVPTKNVKKYEEYCNVLAMQDKLSAYLDYLELDPEEKLMLRFLADKNQFTLQDARHGIKNFYERAITIMPADSLLYFIQDDIDFCENFEIDTNARFLADPGISGKTLYLSISTLAGLLAMEEKKSLPLGKQKLLDAFFNKFDKGDMTDEEILKNHRDYNFLVADACWKILANAKNLGLNKQQSDRLREMNLNALKAIAKENILRRPGMFYILPPALKDIKWNGDENNIIYQIYSEPNVSFVRLSKDLRKKYVADYIEVLRLAKDKGLVSSEDIVENILVKNEELRLVDTLFAERTADLFAEQMKKVNVEQFVLSDKGDYYIYLPEAILNYVDTLQEKSKVIDCFDKNNYAILRNKALSRKPNSKTKMKTDEEEELQ